MFSVFVNSMGCPESKEKKQAVWGTPIEFHIKMLSLLASGGICHTI